MEDSKAGEGELGYESTERGTERRDKVAGDASLSDGKEGEMLGQVGRIFASQEKAWVPSYFAI